MNEFKEVLEKIKNFRDDRDWMRYHNHKDLAVSICIEAAELLEHFQWERKNSEESIQKNKEKIGEEIADVAVYLFELADNLGIDLKQAMEDKIRKNGIKYPVEKVKGLDKKYTEL